MKLIDYLEITLGERYKLNADQVRLAAVVLSAIRDKGITFSVVCAPRLAIFLESDWPVDVYETVSKSRSWFELVRSIDRAEPQANIVDLLNEKILNAEKDISRVALALSSELVLLTNFESTFSEPERATDAGHADEAVQLSEATWLNTGVYVLDEHQWNLTDKMENGAPPEVQIAKLIFSCKNPDTGKIEGRLLEGCAQLLARFMIGSTQGAQETIKALEGQIQELNARGNRGIWPADKEHWIYDITLSAPCAKIPLAPSAAREEMTKLLQRAAKFAVSRASGAGTSRVFNLEGLVDNMVIGVIGEGTEPNADNGRGLMTWLNKMSKQ